MAASYSQPLLSAQHLNPMAAAPPSHPAPAAATPQVAGAPVPMRTSNIAKYAVGQRVSNMGLSGVSGRVIAVKADGGQSSSAGRGGGGGGGGPGVIMIKPGPGAEAAAAPSSSAAAAAAMGGAFPPIRGAIAAKLLASAGRAKSAASAGRAANEAIRMQDCRNMVGLIDAVQTGKLQAMIDAQAAGYFGGSGDFAQLTWVALGGAFGAVGLTSFVLMAIGQFDFWVFMEAGQWWSLVFTVCCFRRSWYMRRLAQHAAQDETAVAAAAAAGAGRSPTELQGWGADQEALGGADAVAAEEDAANERLDRMHMHTQLAASAHKYLTAGVAAATMALFQFGNCKQHAASSKQRCLAMHPTLAHSLTRLSCAPAPGRLRRARSAGHEAFQRLPTPAKAP